MLLDVDLCNTSLLYIKLPRHFPSTWMGTLKMTPVNDTSACTSKNWWESCMINVQDSNTCTSSLGQSCILQVQLYTFATSIWNSSYTCPPSWTPNKSYCMHRFALTGMNVAVIRCHNEMERNSNVTYMISDKIYQFSFLYQITSQ